jgi:PAS domain S-box-containing protein
MRAVEEAVRHESGSKRQPSKANVNVCTFAALSDEKGIIQKWNECATSTLGYTAHEAIGENIKMIMPDDIAAKHDGYLARYMSTGVAHIIGSKRCAHRRNRRDALH